MPQSKLPMLVPLLEGLVLSKSPSGSMTIRGPKNMVDVLFVFFFNLLTGTLEKHPHISMYIHIHM